MEWLAPPAAIRVRNIIMRNCAAMRGAYFVAAQESRELASFAEALIKSLTGGDTVRTRRLHENGFEFVPRFKIWLATNHKPEIKETDTGISQSAHHLWTQ
jgi:putative DNA primase/helicase